MKLENRLLIEEFCRSYDLQILYISEDGTPDVVFSCHPSILLHISIERDCWFIWLAHPRRALNWYFFSKVFGFLNITYPEWPTGSFWEEQTEDLRILLGMLGANWDRVLDAVGESWPHLHVFGDGSKT